MSKCDLCAGAEFGHAAKFPEYLLFSGEVFNLVRCLGCGIHFVNPRPPAHAIGAYYGNDYFAHRTPKVKLRWWQRRVAERGQKPLSLAMRAIIYIRQSLAWQPVPRFEGQGRVLDIGCGGGKWLDVMRKLDWKTSGIELAAPAVTSANTNGHDVVCASAEEFVHEAGAFDVVSLWHVLEHTYSPRVCLSNVHRYLDDGGLLLLCVPNYRSFHSRLFGRFWWSSDAPRHLFQFDRKTLKRYLEEAGFEDVRMTTRTGSSSWVRGIRHTINGVFGTRFESDPKWALALAEGLCVFSSLFRFFGVGSELRVTGRKKRLSV